MFKNHSKQKLIEDIQRRVANIAIGVSTLRGQGPSGIIQKARGYLSSSDFLKELKEISSKEFCSFLDKHTEKLMKQFPIGAQNNWGAARKAINVFLESAFYDRFLTKEYRLDRLEIYLELPLDSNVTKCLMKHFGKTILPRWNGIKKLKRKDSNLYQEYAEKLAKKKGYKARIYLDLECWRSERENLKTFMR